MFYYLILYRPTVQVQVDSLITDVGALNPELYTVPHLFDRDLAPTLQAIWYCLHLPRFEHDTVQLGAVFLGELLRDDIPHIITLGPIEPPPSLDTLMAWQRSPPLLIFCPDADIEWASSLKLDSLLPPIAFSRLSSKSLSEHWDLIAKYKAVSLDLARAPRVNPPWLVDDLMLGQSTVPTQFIARHLGLGGQYAKTTIDSPRQSHNVAFSIRDHVARITKTDDGADPLAGSRLYATESKTQRQRTRMPIVIAAAGVPGRHLKVVQDYLDNEKAPPTSWKALASRLSHQQTEDAVISTLVTHRALACGGIGFRTPDLEPELYQLLSQLEEHCTVKAPKNNVLWRLAKKIGAQLADGMGSEACRILKRASSVVAIGIHLGNCPRGSAT